MRYIKRTREFHEVYSGHEKLHGTLFVFLHRKEKEESEQAVGIVVSRKVGKAVRRNKVKRRVKSYLREHAEELPVGKLVIIAKSLAGESEWGAFKRDLGQNLQRLREL